MKNKLLLCLAFVLSGICHAAIIYPKGPDGGRSLVYTNADAILRSEPRFLGGFRIKDLTIADPYQCYGVGVKDLASGQLLSAAKFSGCWRYPFLHGTNVGAADLWADEKTGKGLKFTALYQAEFSNATLEALRIADQLPQVKNHTYEIRGLDSPGILLQALWLHGKSDDIIIPLGATFGRWNALHPYPENEMIKLLKPEAKKRLKEPRGMLD